jgi:hypothetical protein
MKFDKKILYDILNYVRNNYDRKYYFKFSMNINLYLTSRDYDNIRNYDFYIAIDSYSNGDEYIVVNIIKETVGIVLYRLESTLFYELYKKFNRINKLKELV